MDKSVMETSQTTSAARQSIPDPVLHSMHAIAQQQYEFEQSILSQQLWSQQQAVSMEVSIKAVALQAAVQANGISHILKGRNDISTDEVVKEIQSDRVIEGLKSSWNTQSWHSSASRLTSGSGHKDDLKEEEICPAEGCTSERHHKDDLLDHKDTRREFHGSKDRRHRSSDYRSHRLHHHRRSRSRGKSSVRSRARSRGRSRSRSRSRSRYLSRSPPKKYNEGRSRSRTRTRTRSRYRSRSPPEKHSRGEHYSYGPEDLKSPYHRQETHRTSLGGQTKSGNSHGDNCVQTHSGTPQNCPGEQEKKDLLTKDNNDRGVGKGGKNDTGKGGLMRNPHDCSVQVHNIFSV
ncbi:uncharacterized protein DDB_G0287625-like [Rhodamnia argentea]|uniref:Uncharacterized protein DDB_G0287625-like n=1 Tax=Rhodamnia argentea TaxID=178133 RepID=A0A8B8NS90_9MYRT|nr:uncharacterized protein DDB_G0287625-like [Rhodamnia argentea]XP_030524781.1 uncharacterized protein DDB_G0287625-like [Rhodamnia argentea]XP_030524782.1 uncharacterized protein DDB_G0287625-like [Rhodamnia argentea]XP_030524783.1 uncharacterized protein DDB_G0287625-like [Rhodamnia argentea]XP_048140927.1 uncharacterized protein DDB_G0287625-like [Rhodamnia argentea]